MVEALVPPNIGVWTFPAQLHSAVRAAQTGKRDLGRIRGGTDAGSPGWAGNTEMKADDDPRPRAHTPRPGLGRSRAYFHSECGGMRDSALAR